jgi:hypothetical protein
VSDWLLTFSLGALLGLGAPLACIWLYFTARAWRNRRRDRIPPTRLAKRRAK